MYVGTHLSGLVVLVTIYYYPLIIFSRCALSKAMGGSGSLIVPRAIIALRRTSSLMNVALMSSGKECGFASLRGKGCALDLSYPRCRPVRRAFSLANSGEVICIVCPIGGVRLGRISVITSGDRLVSRATGDSVFCLSTRTEGGRGPCRTLERVPGLIIGRSSHSVGVISKTVPLVLVGKRGIGSNVGDVSPGRIRTIRIVGGPSTHCLGSKMRYIIGVGVGRGATTCRACGVGAHRVVPILFKCAKNCCRLNGDGTSLDLGTSRFCFRRSSSR